MTASIPEAAPLTGKNTVHFHGIANFKEMAKSGNYVADRSSIFPRRYQWRAYFFACLHNTLLCLPTGMGKTLIGHLLIKAYRTLNPNQAQIFIVPTVVLVEQQAATIERNTGLKVMRRSSEHNSRVPWTSKEVAVCTPAMLNHGFKMKQIDMSQIALLVFDEVHEANSPNSEYGLILPLIAKCHEPHRPRILALTASPSGVNTKSIRESILGLCDKLDALPFSPLVDDEKNTHQVKDVDCEYIDIGTTPFELCFEKFVFTTLENLAKLDSFFESNWNEVNSNVAANIRVHAVDKVLSHAESTARYQNNEKLFQLTRFMKKWSQSLDLLKIFGPKKLLEFIRSDLNYAYKSDSLKEIREEILAMIPSFLEKFSEMESKFNIESDSTRAAILMEKLKQHRTDTSRIIVFVERRMTAERICRRLQEDPDTSSLNPEFIVGMSSGGISKERQQDIMKKFRDGTCQVLIATSVLEQGIDVAACNVVICFDGVKSIKSIIQSRGRARKQAASFIVFVSTEGRSRVNELTSKELEMDYAIQQLMHEKDSKIEIEMDQEIDNFLDGNFEETVENINDDENEVDEIDEENEELEEFEDSFLIVFRFFNYSDQEALIEHISSFFTSPRDRLKSSKKFVVAKFNVKDNVEERSKLIRVSRLNSQNFSIFTNFFINRKFQLSKIQNKRLVFRHGFNPQFSTTKNILK